MKKIYYKKIISLFLIAFFVATTSSCSNGKLFREIESGDWIYTTNYCAEGHCALLGLSETGKTKDVIVMPTMLDGLIVYLYGNQKGYKSSPDIVFDNCKKLYCNYSYITICTGIEFGNQEMEGFFPQKYSPSSMDLFYVCSLNNKANLYLSKDLYEYNIKKLWVERECSIANIEYYMDEENCFFVDNVENGKIEVIPPTPLRYDNEGYVFEGLYYNDIKWDFEKNLVEDYFDENNHLRLDAKWEKK